MLNAKEIYDLEKSDGIFSFCEKCGAKLNRNWKVTLCYSCKTHDEHHEKSVKQSISIKNSIKKHNNEQIYVRICRNKNCLIEFSTRIKNKYYCSSFCKQRSRES
jgi:hypothetical protein